MRVFTEMKTYLLDLSSKKKKLAILRERFTKLGDQRLLNQIFAGWVNRSSYRMGIYKGVLMLEGSVKVILGQGKFKTLKSSFDEVKRWTKHEAQLQGLTSRFLASQRKKRLQKGFGSLEMFMRNNISQRRALNLLTQILKARACKTECFNLILTKARHQVEYLKLARQVDQIFKNHSMMMVMTKLANYCQRQIQLVEKANSKMKENQHSTLMKLIGLWRGIVSRKKLVNMKGNNLSETLENRMVIKFMKLWSKRVFSDKHSLYYRFKTLEKCLTQVRAIRAIDQMSSNLLSSRCRTVSKRKKTKTNTVHDQR